MNPSTEIYLSYKRDNLQRMMMLQREVIVSGLHPTTKPDQADQDLFPRSETMRFVCSERGLLFAQIVAKLLMRRHPRTLSVIKTFGQLLLKNQGSKK